MTKSTKVTASNPAANQVDPEVVQFRAEFDERSPLDQIVQDGARKMLQDAIEAEVADFLTQFSDRVDEQGRRLVVRNGHKPTRTITTGAGQLDVQQPRVRDNSPDKANRAQFSSSILPPYLRRSKSIDELIPWLYLKGISSGDLPGRSASNPGRERKGTKRQCRGSTERTVDQGARDVEPPRPERQAICLHLGGWHSCQDSPGR